MLKFNKSSMRGLIPKKKSVLLKDQPTPNPSPAPAPGPSPETPPPLPLPSKTPTPIKTSSPSTAAPNLIPSTPSPSGKPPAFISSKLQSEIANLDKKAVFDLLNGFTDRPKSDPQPKGSRTVKIAPIIKPSGQEKFGGMVMMTDGGQSGVSEDGLIYDPRTRESEKGIDLTAPISAPRKTEKQKVSSTLGIPTEHIELAKIVAMLPDDFDFEGWENMTAFQQEKAIRNSGLSKEEQMKILNAGTSIETIAIIQDIQANRQFYGLSQSEANSIASQLMEIANLRIGVKNHLVPESMNPNQAALTLKMLDHRQAALLGPYYYTDTYYSPDFTDSSKAKPNVDSDKMNPLHVGKYIGYNKIDITNDLNAFMSESASMMKESQASARRNHTSFMTDFIRLVGTGGPLDIKSQRAWRFQQGYEYTYDGLPLNNDDPGNIAFGYYGAAVFGKEFLQIGAGLYQLVSDIKHNKPIQVDGKYFDNPRDNEMIRYGYDLYMEDNQP